MRTFQEIRDLILTGQIDKITEDNLRSLIRMVEFFVRPNDSTEDYSDVRKSLAGQIRPLHMGHGSKYPCKQCGANSFWRNPDDNLNYCLQCGKRRRERLILECPYCKSELLHAESTENVYCNVCQRNLKGDVLLNYKPIDE